MGFEIKKSIQCSNSKERYSESTEQFVNVGPPGETQIDVHIGTILN